MSSTPISRWQGITCNADNQVTAISFRGCRWLQGDITAIEWPKDLRSIDLGMTSFGGDLSKVEKWPRYLLSLELSFTGVSGNIGIAKWPPFLNHLGLHNTSAAIPRGCPQGNNGPLIYRGKQPIDALRNWG